MLIFGVPFPKVAGGGGSTDLGTAPEWYRAKLEPLRTTTGTQTITFDDTTWTPKAVRITFAETPTLNAETAGGSISQGSSDLTNTRCTIMNISGTYTRGLADKILSTHSLAYQAVVSGAAPGQITLNVTASGGAAHYILVEVFGGPLVGNAKVGSLEVASSGQTVVNVGFETNLMFMSCVREANFPGTLNSSVWDTGFATQRSGRLRRVETNVIYANGAWTVDPHSVTAVNVSGINGNSIAFDNYSNAFTLRSAFLALSLDPSVDLWAGLARINPGTGAGNIITENSGFSLDSPALKLAPSFTPRAMLFNANRASVEGGTSTPGNSFGIGSMSALGQFMIGARKPSSGTSGAISVRNDGLNIPDKDGANPYAGTMLGFGTDEANLNVTAQQSDKTRVIPVLLMGSDGVEPTRADAINPARTGSNIVLSNNNFVFSKTASSAAEPTCQVTRGISAATANHYFECMMASGSPNYAIKPGVANGSKSLSTAMGTDTNSWCYLDYLGGTKGFNGTYTAYGTGFKEGDVVGVLLKNGKLYFARNGVWLNGADLAAETGFAFSGLTGTLYPSVSIYKNGAVDIFGSIHLYEDQFHYPVPTGASAWGT